MSATTMINPWKTKVVTTEDKKDFEAPKGGTYPAVLVGLIDLGTHTEDSDKGPRDVHKILFVWELSAEFDSKGNAFKVWRDFTLSLHNKSNLRPFVQGWLGRKLADNEEFDVSTLHGGKCQVTLTEGTTKNGKSYIDVSAAAQPMKGLTVPDATVDLYAFQFVRGVPDGNGGFAEQQWDPRIDPDIPDWVPPMYGRSVKAEIKKSKEWAALTPF